MRYPLRACRHQTRYVRRCKSYNAGHCQESNEGGSIDVAGHGHSVCTRVPIVTYSFGADTTTLRRGSSLWVMSTRQWSWSIWCVVPKRQTYTMTKTSRMRKIHQSSVCSFFVRVLQNPSVQCLFFFCSCCASWCRSKALRARTPPVDCLNLVQAPRVEDDGIQAETEETCSWRYNI